MTGIIGIDPGLTGGIARLDSTTLTVHDMPVVDGAVDCYTLTDLLADWGAVDRVYVEHQQGRPGQAVNAVYKAATNYGRILGVLAALHRPVAHVRPAAWTKALGVGADKGAHRRRAQDEWPDMAHLFSRVKDDGRADAALIALWGARQ